METGGFISGLTEQFKRFLSLDLFTLALATIFVVTIAALWARGPLENILRE